MAYAEVAVRGDFQRRGGARERRGSVAVRRSWVRIRSITRGWVMKATMLRPAAADFRERERHGLGLHGRGLLVGASPAPNAAGPVGVPAIVALEHLALVGNVAHHAHLPLRQADGSHRGQRDSGRPGVPGARGE